MALLNQTQQEYYDGDNFGGYQFTSLNHIINNFMFIYVGEGKIIPKIKRIDVAFHAQRALAELSFDTLKSIKSQEINLPPSNTMVLPQDYVNYTKICWVDKVGIEHPLYPTRHTSNPTPIFQNSNDDYSITAVGTLTTLGQDIVLDGEYTNILVGMSVSGPSIPSALGLIVSATSNLNNVTTISVTLANGTAPVISFTGAETLTFANNPNANLVLESESYVLESATWIVNDNKITAGTIADVSNISVGMIVSNEAFPVDTVVTDVNTTTGIISVDRNPSFNTTAVSTAASSSVNNEITFIKYKDSTTWDRYIHHDMNKDSTIDAYDYDDDVFNLHMGQRYGISPEHSQVNGTFYIDELKGRIHFSSNVGGRNIVLKYISDGLGSENEMVVHKFAEEAMYKCIAYAVLSTSINGQSLVGRFKQEKFAATRLAKLRLSNIKMDELAQIMRGKSKWIKH